MNEAPVQVSSTRCTPGPPYTSTIGGIALGRVEMRRLEQPVVERLAVRGREGAEFGHRVVREIGCVRMVLIQTILEQVGDQAAVGIAQAHLRRLRCGW